METGQRGRPAKRRARDDRRTDPALRELHVSVDGFDDAANLTPPEPALTADRPKRWQRARVSPASDGAWGHREQLSNERGREYVGVVVIGLADGGTTMQKAPARGEGLLQ
jgi:hypothetical protein